MRLNPEQIAQYLGVLLGLTLVVKLLSLRLHVVYRLFSFYLLADMAASIYWLLQLWFKPLQHLDYRLFWVANRAIVDVLMIATVYALLSALLGNLQGILSLSRKVLNGSFLIAAFIGVLTAASESRAFDIVARHTTLTARLVLSEVIADRVVSSVVLLVIVSMLCYLLWFPVPTPRNLAVFIVGFAAYAAGSTVGLLFQSLLLHALSKTVNTFLEVLTCVCCAFWAVCISPAGESAPFRLSVPWKLKEQERLLLVLDQLNQSLLRTAQH